MNQNAEEEHYARSILNTDKNQENKNKLNFRYMERVPGSQMNETNKVLMY